MELAALHSIPLGGGSVLHFFGDGGGFGKEVRAEGGFARLSEKRRLSVATTFGRPAARAKKIKSHKKEWAATHRS